MFPETDGSEMVSPLMFRKCIKEANQIHRAVDSFWRHDRIWPFFYFCTVEANDEHFEWMILRVHGQ